MKQLACSFNLVWGTGDHELRSCSVIFLAIFLVFGRFRPFLVLKKGIRQTFFKKWTPLSDSAWKNMQFSFSHHRLKTNIFWLPEQAHRFTGYLISHPGVPPPLPSSCAMTDIPKVKQMILLSNCYLWQFQDSLTWVQVGRGGRKSSTLQIIGVRGFRTHYLGFEGYIRCKLHFSGVRYD